MEIPPHWLSTLVREDDCLTGEWPMTFGGRKGMVTVSFVTGAGEPTGRQVNTLTTYLEREGELSAKALAAIFERYQRTVEKYRTAFREWGEDPDALAPMTTDPEELLPLLELQTMFVPAEGEGAFGLGFWSRWEREHGIGVRFSGWKVAEAGDGEVHFAFPEAAE